MSLLHVKNSMKWMEENINCLLFWAHTSVGERKQTSRGEKSRMLVECNFQDTSLK